MLERVSEMLVENRVEVVVISPQISVQVGAKSGIRVVDSSRVVISFPELDRSHVGTNEDSASCRKTTIQQ